MKKTIFILGIVWFVIVTIPSSVLMFKLTKYLIDTNFQNWWVTIIWTLVTLPVTSLFILILTTKKENKK